MPDAIKITSCQDCLFHRVETPWTGITRDCVADTFLEVRSDFNIPRDVQGIPKECPLRGKPVTLCLEVTE